MSNLTTLIDRMRTRTGLPERGTAGKTRMKDVFNEALRHLWGDLPEGLKNEQWRFRTEEVYNRTVGIHTVDKHTFIVTAAQGALPLDGTLSGRWIEVYRDAHWIQRRIREVWLGDTFYYIIIDEPWDNNTDHDLTARIWTAEYPYPHDYSDFTDLIFDPDNADRNLLPAMLAPSLSAQRIGNNWRDQGIPEFYGSGSFAQLPAFHFTPTVGVYGTPGQPANSEKWGWDALGVEHAAINPFYGVAGTFKYLEVPVWGRWRWLQSTKLRSGRLLPFYMGAPSLPSDAITTTWGSNAIQIVGPNYDYLLGFGQDTTLPSHNKAGIERWVFRGRFNNEAAGASNHAAERFVEADEVYYLWDVLDGSTTTYVDRGDRDPIDRHFPLRHCHGHRSLQFDRVPTAATDVLVMAVRRPPEFKWDTDTPRIPPESTDALFFRAAMILVGEMDGHEGRMTYFKAQYEGEIERLRREQGVPRFIQPEFGDGLSTGTASRSARIHGSTITW